MIRRYLLALSLVAQMICGATAQQTGNPTLGPPPPPQKPGDTEVVRITTNLVQVDAIITDKNGKAVSDLKPEEVQIFQDGKIQKITNFLYSSAGSSVAETSPPSRVEPNQTIGEPKAPSVPPKKLIRDDVRRSIALVIDDLGMSFESIAYVRRALNKFINKQMQPGEYGGRHSHRRRRGAPYSNSLRTNASCMPLSTARNTSLWEGRIPAPSRR